MNEHFPRLATRALEMLEAYEPTRDESDASLLGEVRVAEAIYWLRNSIKFLGPRGGEFIERLDAVGSDIDFPRLPYEAICLEYSYGDWAPNPSLRAATNTADVQPDHVCAIAFYPTDRTPIGRLARNLYGPLLQEEFVVWPISGHRAGRTIEGVFLPNGGWAPLVPVLVTPKPRPSGIVLQFIGQEKRIGMQALYTRADIEMHVNANARRGVHDLTSEELLHAIANDAGSEARAIVEMCNVLECTNVTTSLLPVPERLNRKRAARGKPPFFSYYVLEIRGDEQTRTPDAGGTHASPRLHYRRGHVRRLRSGRKTWVRPAMVGDKSRGMIVKDYGVGRSGS